MSAIFHGVLPKILRKHVQPTSIELLMLPHSDDVVVVARFFVSGEELARAARNGHSEAFAYIESCFTGVHKVRARVWRKRSLLRPKR